MIEGDFPLDLQIGRGLLREHVLLAGQYWHRCRKACAVFCLINPASGSRQSLDTS